MRRDLVVFEHEKFEVTGYNVWMTAGEIAKLFGVTIMKVRGIIRKINEKIPVRMDLLSKYDLLENGYKDELYNLEAIIVISYFIDTGLVYDFRIGYATGQPRRKNVLWCSASEIAEAPGDSHRSGLLSNHIYV